MNEHQTKNIDELYSVGPSLYSAEIKDPHRPEDAEVEAVPTTIRGVVSHATKLLSRHYLELLPLGIVSAILGMVHTSLKLWGGLYWSEVATGGLIALIVGMSGVYSLFAYIAAMRWCARASHRESLWGNLLTGTDVLWPMLKLGLGLMGVALLLFIPAIVAGVAASATGSVFLWVPTVVLILAGCVLVMVPGAYYGQTTSALVLEPQLLRMSWAETRAQFEGRVVRAAWIYGICSLPLAVPSFISSAFSGLPSVPISIALVAPALITFAVFPLLPAVDLALYRAFAGPQDTKHNDEPSVLPSILEPL